MLLFLECSTYFLVDELILVVCGFISDKDGYQGYHVSWTRQKETGGPTKSRPTRPEGTGQGAHNRGGLEDNYKIKYCK
jgi:hypothetical protein